MLLEPFALDNGGTLCMAARADFECLVKCAEEVGVYMPTWVDTGSEGAQVSAQL